ncbi:MAG: oligosaccharide flippase family protein [Candidatus Helarchaeota archaeon]
MTQELVKYQVWSVATRIITTALSFIQGIIIIRILTPAEYGLIGIVLAVAGLIGVLEHFGLASGSIREISITKTLSESSKILFTSLFVRVAIILPLAIGLFFASGHISNNIYHHPEIAFPLKLFSLILLFQGGQDISAAFLSGLQKFKQLFLFQIANSIIGLLIFVILVKYKGFIGYFFAMLSLSLLSITILTIINFKVAENKFILPNRKEFLRIFKNVFSIGIAVYIIKILYIMWQKGGILIAGIYLLPKEIGYINFALFLGLKTTFFTDAISGVNLPVMSKKYNEDVEIFKKEFKENFCKMLVLVLFGCTAFIFYSKEIITLLVGTKYTPSFSLIPFFVSSSLLYSLINLIGVSVILPALLLREAIYYYLILCLASSSAIWFFLVMDFGALGVAIGILLGVLLSFLLQNIIIYKRLRFSVFDTKVVMLSISLIPLLIVYLLTTSQIIKAIFFLGVSYLYFSLSKKLGILDWKKILRLKFIITKSGIRTKII